MNKNRLKTLLIILPLLASMPAWAQFDNAFQSTSTMQGSGSSYASNPSINGAGQATYGMPNSRRDGEGTGIEGDDEEGDTPTPGSQGGSQIPLGSAVPALLLLAGGYAAFVAYRKRKVE